MGFNGRQLAMLVMAAGQLMAQAPPLTLEQAVRAALEKYPSARVSEAEIRRAAAGIQLARTAYLPRLDAVAGVNRATRNNLLGLLLPSQVMAPLSGPVLNTNGMGNAWGSTVGMLATWEPFDFGQRKAQVSVAEAGQTRAQAAAARTQFEVALSTADSFLTLVAAQQTVKAAEAAVDRSAEFQRITDALVQAELRPGVESSLARAERASAEAQLIRARQTVGETQAVLAGLLGVEAKNLQAAPGRLLEPPGDAPRDASVEGNPTVREQGAVIAESEARLHVLDRSYYPKFTLQGTTYARGSGALPDGRLLGGLNGLGPNIQNWALGFTASFPLLELASIRARRSSESAQLDGERARREQLLVELRIQRDKALAAYEGTKQVAVTTPVMVEAARAAVEQARARYQAGLGAGLEVADAQRRLAQAEIDDSLARLNIWRARLAWYAAQGSIEPLLAEAGR